MTAASDRLLAALGARFEAARDAERAVRMSAYMRNQFAFYGIPNPTRVALEREAGAEVGAGELGERDLKAFALASWRCDEREHQYAAGKLLRQRAAVLSPGFLTTAQRLIATKSWWDTVDELADHVVGAIVRAHPSQRAVMDRWLVDDDFWLARTAILHQLDWKGDTDADWLFAACIRRAGDKEFFIRKAIGWALRSYSYVDPVAVERFVTDHAGQLSGLSRREGLKAIERTRRRSST